MATAVVRGASARAVHGRGTSTSRPRPAGGPQLQLPPQRSIRASEFSEQVVRFETSREPRPDRDDIGPVPGSGVQAASRTTVDCPGIGGGASAADAPKFAESVVRAREERLSGRVPTGWWEPVSYPNAQPPGTADRDPSAPRATASNGGAIVTQARPPCTEVSRVRLSAVRRQTLGEERSSWRRSRRRPTSTTPVRRPRREPVIGST